MFVFYYKNFVGNLDIQAPTHMGIPPKSPVIIIYKEKGYLSKHEILKMFRQILSKNNITYLRPLKNLTSEWIIDLQEFKHTFSCLKGSKYLKGQITIEPEYIHDKKTDRYSNEITNEETLIKFFIHPDDVKMHSANYSSSILPDELNTPLVKFRKDFPEESKSAFLMMKFEDTPIQKKIINVLENIFENHGIKLLRADNKCYSDDLLTNIRTYMHGCDFGVALFDRIKTEYFNPNVSLEIGYMMAMKKDILLLKDNTLNSLHTDLVGRLYFAYDFQKPEETLPTIVNKWLKDKEILTT